VTGPKVTILGAGRVGSSLHRALADAGAAGTLIWTRTEATALAARKDGVPAVFGELPSIPSGLIFLAVSDPAVAPLAATLAKSGLLKETAIVAHVSGALDLTPLEPLKSAGIATGSFHPVVSVASRRTTLRGTFAAIDAAAPLADMALGGIAALLGMSVIRPRGDRGRYHAAAAIAGNFPQVLLEAAIRLLLEAGLTREEAQAAFGPLLVSAAENAARQGPAGGLTGPVARGDADLVQRHLRALEGGSRRDLAELYRAATRIAADLAEQQGVADVDAIRQLVAPAKKP
jgi:predicted short-subunit dehydrogenase-like oxidoreductase (DUF2520 family)